MQNPPSSNTLWTDAELADAVDAYVFMLRAQSFGLVYRKEIAATALLDEGLPDRNDASLRYRFRNISAVVQQMGVRSLIGYSPAQQVGSGVRERIRRLLVANPYFLELMSPSYRGPTDRGGDRPPGSPLAAIEALAGLRQQLDDIEREILGIGHNNPPEPLSMASSRRAAFDEARSDITALQEEVASPAADPVVVRRHSERLLQFGVKMAAWIGQRTTKFIDAGLQALAPVLVVKLTGLLPQIIDALSAVARVIPH